MFSPLTDQELLVDRKSLTEWYVKNHRQLPWRENNNPYLIWVSEVMLQQTTVATVTPFYKAFIQRFPNLETLAQASLEDIFDKWAGLGYYSRARNLHKAAQVLQTLDGFPQTSKELLKLPGFGPYTARAVASLAFEENVGVLDGNVIRVLSRRFGFRGKWWTVEGRRQLQAWSDQLCARGKSSDINQGLMELGATICTSRNPTCLLCPWLDRCMAFDQDQVQSLPIKKPRRKTELWLWKPSIILRGREQKREVALVKNTYAPFLHGHAICPGTASLIKKAPKKFSFKHSITHHNIFVQIETSKLSDLELEDNSSIEWVNLQHLNRYIPSSMVRKAIKLKS